MNSGQFSVTIYSHSARKAKAKAIKNGYDYVILRHNSRYFLILSNRSHSRCDATVMVDGRRMGKFRINPYDNIKVGHLHKFIFLKNIMAVWRLWR